MWMCLTSAVMLPCGCRFVSLGIFRRLRAPWKLRKGEAERHEERKKTQGNVSDRRHRKTKTFGFVTDPTYIRTEREGKVTREATVERTPSLF